jgi:FemAB-related protein (PEP-CTERM system-associated)
MSKHMVMAPPPLSLKVRLGTAADDAEISAFVRAHPAGTVFHLPEWGAAVARGCGQVQHCFVVEGDGTLAGILPLTEMHSPLFGRALVSNGFAVGGGLLTLSDNATTLLIEEATKLAKRLSCGTIELKGGALPKGWHHDTETYVGFSRPLEADDEAELLAIPRKQRAEVRKGLDNNLTVETGNTPRDRDAHYTVYAESVRNLGTPVFPRTLFEEVLNAFWQTADILTVRHEGVAVASVLSLYHNNSVMPYWGGGTHAARHLRANEVMYYALMNHARQRGCTQFDFGRSKVGTGAAAYKKNWGFEPEPLSYAKLALDGKAPRSINPLDPKFGLQVRVWKQLPLPIANRIGPWIARGLG